MNATRAGVIVEYIRKSAAARGTDPTLDRELLHRFATAQDEAAFRTLVQRHGPMVHQLCQRLLGNWHDAEDVCQAVFLVLASQAGSRRWQESIAAWLHQVAYHLARKAQAAAASRRARERQAVLPLPVDPVDEITARELQATLHEELARLPEKYRAPLVLCYLEGATRDEAARQLGWPLSTLKSRVERGRELLRSRLTRRGLTLSATLSIALRTEKVAQASLPAGLMSGIVQAAVRYAAGQIPSAAVGMQPALSLARDLLKAMFLNKVRLAAVWLLGGCLLAAGAGLAMYCQVPAEPAEASGQHLLQPSAPDNGKLEVAGNAPARTDRYGDPLPPRVLARLGTVRLRHGDEITELAFSPADSILASTSRDGTLRLWDASTGKELRRMGSFDRPIAFFAFSADGILLATGSGTDAIHLWVVPTGTELRSFKNPGFWLGQVAISPDGTLIAASGNNHHIAIFDATTGLLLHTLDGKERSPFAAAIAFSPDSRTLASARQEDQTIRLWDLATGAERRRFSVSPPEPHDRHPNKRIDHLAFSPNGKLLACCGSSQDISLWDLSTGKDIRRLSGGNYVYRVAFSPDGKMLASGSYPGLYRLWDLNTFQPVREFSSGRVATTCVAFSQDGRTLATSVGPGICLWDVPTGKETLPDRGHTAELSSCTLLPDQRTLLTATRDGTVRQWDLATGNELRKVSIPSTSHHGIVLSPDGTSAACFKDQELANHISEVGIRLWDLAAHKERALLWRPNTFGAFFSADGKVLFTSSWDLKENAGLIRSWDVATGKELRVLARHSNGFKSAVLSGDGKLLATLLPDREKTICCWDTATGKERCRVAVDSLFSPCFAFSPDNNLLAVADGWRPICTYNRQRYVHLWDSATGKKLRQFGESDGGDSHPGYQAITFSLDGRTLATAGDGNRIHLWETATGSERLVLEGHIGRITGLLFAENGKTLISTSSDTTALVWDLTGLRAQGGLQQEKRLPGDLDDLWTTLADRNGVVAYQAIWRLAAVPGRTVPFLRDHLHVRQQATQELTELDQLAKPALRKALAGQPSAELKRRIEQLVEQMETTPSATQLRAIRAVEALELAGTAEAQRLLEELTKGAPEARLTQEARSSLQRLAKQTSPVHNQRRQN